MPIHVRESSFYTPSHIEDSAPQDAQLQAGQPWAESSPQYSATRRMIGNALFEAWFMAAVAGIHSIVPEDPIYINALQAIVNNYFGPNTAYVHIRYIVGKMVAALQFLTGMPSGDFDRVRSLDRSSNIIVQAVQGKITSVIAETTENVIELHPLFYHDNQRTSIAEIKIVPDLTTLEALVNVRSATFIHELAHVPGICGALDHTQTILGCCGLAGDENALLNPESWTIYAAAKLLTDAYPEFDFSGLHIVRRLTLLHHFSGYDVFRHGDHGSVWDLPGYDSSKDT
ncbi:hypothetical protein LTS08_005816 [Lithohypha guttulata]|nr:hypothetical protein LTS08_005816 [Lithohypha guttulata]